MEAINILSFMKLQNDRYSIITSNDYRYLAKGDRFENHEYETNGVYVVQRVYYNKKRNESTILCKKI